MNKYLDMTKEGLGKRNRALEVFSNEYTLIVSHEKVCERWKSILHGVESDSHKLLCTTSFNDDFEEILANIKDRTAVILGVGVDDNIQASILKMLKSDNRIISIAQL